MLTAGGPDPVGLARCYPPADALRFYLNERASLASRQQFCIDPTDRADRQWWPGQDPLPLESYDLDPSLDHCQA